MTERIDRPWIFLRYLLADRRAALFAADRALLHRDAATVADSIVKANEAADVLRVFGVA